MTMSVDGGFADGLHALWNLLFICGLPDACEFVVDLVSRFQSPKAIITFIEECLTRPESVRTLGEFILLVIRIEFPLDAKDLGITKNEFHLPNYSVVVKLKGEITRELKVLRHYPVLFSRQPSHD
jgi:hypothetical protein